MSKIELLGPKDLLQNCLALLREMGILQIEPVSVGFIEKGQDEYIRSLAMDEQTLYERMFLEDLRRKTDELLSYMAGAPVRKSYLDPHSIIDTISKLIVKHTENMKDLHDKREALQKELGELDRYGLFMESLSGLLEKTRDAPDLDFIGLTVKEPEMVEHLRDALSRITDWKYELQTEPVEDGGLVGLIIVEKEISEKVKKALSDERVPELRFPEAFSGLPFAEKISYIRKRIADIRLETGEIDKCRQIFSHRWLPIYRKLKEWLEDRLSLLQATASVFETRMCFFITGWIPSADLQRLREALLGSFQGSVLVEEKEMSERDLERVPIVLRNPSFFKPFEIFTRMLPLPAYTSYDPTPFIAIFFPVFFGMILGDAGYGLLLLPLSLIGIKKFQGRGLLSDASKVLLMSSSYAIVFGIIYGEFFGDLPERIFGFEPLCIERRRAVIPMMFFAVAVGVGHSLLGFVLGAIGAYRKNNLKEAVYKALSFLILFILLIVIGSYFGVIHRHFAKPFLYAILFILPILIFTGGILAPLELLKSIGNIISYVRIMAIGLTSVLLAFVANRLAGLTGDVVTGILIGTVLHFLNLILGVFSPTIHSLRLHYVEFFSKFLEHGGRKFEPLQRGP